MEKRMAGLLGAVAALGTMGSTQAAPAPAPAPVDVLQASSYADLLQPIPNAAALLRVVDERSPVPSAEANVQLARYHHHHHHHHHHGYSRRPVIVIGRHRHHHHHHHHHNR